MTAWQINAGVPQGSVLSRTFFFACEWHVSPWQHTFWTLCYQTGRRWGKSTGACRWSLPGSKSHYTIERWKSDHSCSMRSYLFNVFCWDTKQFCFTNKKRDNMSVGCRKNKKVSKFTGSYSLESLYLILTFKSMTSSYVRSVITL